jgi:hypothetical protein
MTFADRFPGRPEAVWVPAHKLRSFQPCKVSSRVCQGVKESRSQGVKETQRETLASLGSHQANVPVIPIRLSHEEPEAGNLHIRVCEIKESRSQGVKESQGVKADAIAGPLAASRPVAPRIAFSGRKGPANPSGPRREAIRSPHRRANIEVGRSAPIASIGHGHAHI